MGHGDGLIMYDPAFCLSASGQGKKKEWGGDELPRKKGGFSKSKERRQKGGVNKAV